MTNILDEIAKTHQGKFRPANPDEYFALRIATRLGEPEAAAYYAILASQYPQHKLLCAYSKMNGDAKSHNLPGRVFRDYLDGMGANGHATTSSSRLLSIRVERRIIAAAVFTGTALEGHRVRQLSADPSAAAASAMGLIKEVLSDEDCTLAAIERAPERNDILRAAIHRAVAAEVQSWGISLWEISIQTLLNAYSHPALKHRPEMREQMLNMWPQLLLKPAHHCVLDALALGLFVQTERLLNNF